MRKQPARSESGRYAILDLVLMETGRYQERFMRDLKPGRLDGRTIDNLLDNLHQSGGTGFSSGYIFQSGSPSLVLNPRVVPQDDFVTIDGGWNKKRFCYFMIVEDSSYDGYNDSKLYFVSGYTDKLDYSSHTRSLPQGLRFYVSSVSECEVNGDGLQNVVSDFNLFSSVNLDSVGDDLLYMTRPVDVFKRTAADDVARRNGGAYSYSSDQVTNRTPSGARRRNGLPTNFVSTLLTGLHKGRMDSITQKMYDSDSRYESDNDRPYGDNTGFQRYSGRMNEIEYENSATKRHVMDVAPTEYEFIQELRSAGIGSNSTGSFRFGDLIKFCPSVESITQVSVVGNSLGSSSRRYERNNTRMSDMDGRNWGTSTIEEIIATELAAAVPIFATQSLITNIDVVFVLTRNEFGERGWEFNIPFDDQSGNLCVAIHDSVPPELDEALLQKFGNLMISEVLSTHGRTGVDIVINLGYDKNKEVSIDVAIDTDEPYHLNTPLFSDNLTSTMVTRNASNTGALGRSLTEIYNTIFNANKGI